jgi:hypothetical protein
MTDENPNTNCLEGMQCPECKSYGPFCIDVLMTVTVYDNGTEDDGGDTEWDENSRCICPQCDYAATVAEFTTREDQ